MIHSYTGTQFIPTQEISCEKSQTKSPTTKEAGGEEVEAPHATPTRSETQVAIDEYEYMHGKFRADVEEILGPSKTQADKPVFGTMSKVTAANSNPDIDVFTFLTVCYIYGGHDAYAHCNLKDGSFHYVERYTVSGSEVNKNELLCLADDELLHRVLMIGASPDCCIQCPADHWD